MRRLLAALLAALVFIFGAAEPATANVRVDRQTNNFRERHDLHRLKSAQGGENILWRLARRRTLQIERVFAHRSDWQWFFDRLPACATGIGENIAYKTSSWDYPYGSWPFAAWRRSTPHRHNMLGRWTWQASAIRTDSDGRTYAVQLFVKGCRHRATL